MHNTDIVITGLQAWELGMGSNCKNLAIEFARQNRVLYVNPPKDRFTMLKNKRKADVENAQFLYQASHNLWVLNPVSVIESISRLPINFLFDMLNKHNNKLFAAEIKQAIQALRFQNYIHFCDSDMFRSFYFKEILKPALSIYYTRDNLLAVDYWKVQGKRIEPLMMKKSDLVVANSPYLAGLAQRFNKNSYYVGQGCDLQAFSPHRVSLVPDDIAHISPPIIGYIGAIKSLRLDISILLHIAKHNPQWNLVLVGAEDEVFAKSDLHLLPNVWFLGKKSESELPQYLMKFDVAINPQIVNDVTRGNYPRKIDEYLAMGKPVVATYTETMSYFREHVSLATTPQQWIQFIDDEIHNNTPEKQQARMHFAGLHTWENNVNVIYDQISNLLKK